jgi:predicted kinase
MGKVVILSGCAGTGKTPYAKKLCEDFVKNNPEQTAVRIAIDDFFVGADGKYKWLKSLSHKAVAATFRQFVQSMLGGIDLIVVDNTNCLTHEVYAYMVAASAYGYASEIITFRCQGDKLPELAKRSEHNVELKRLHKQYRNLQYRNLFAWWHNTNVDVEL